MPRGLPDYYNPDTLVSQRLANVEEVVTALRKIGNIDNRGRTLFYENFHENLAGWRNVNGGDAEYAVISTVRAYTLLSSCFIDAGTSGGSGTTYIGKHVQLGASANLGLETAILYKNDAPEYQIIIEYNLEGDNYKAYLSILPASGVLRVGIPGSWTTVGNVGYNASGTRAWLSVKLVADFENNMFVRALVGQEQIDLSAYALSSAPHGAHGLARAVLLAAAVNAVTNDGYFGYAAFTIDEP